MSVSDRLQVPSTVVKGRSYKTWRWLHCVPVATIATEHSELCEDRVHAGRCRFLDAHVARLWKEHLRGCSGVWPSGTSVFLGHSTVHGLLRW